MGISDADQPLIVPTPSGYQLARGIEHSLRTRYMPERYGKPGMENLDLWVPTTVLRFANSQSRVDIDRHIRGRDSYVVADVESHATPTASEAAYRLALQRDEHRVEDGKGKPLEACLQKLSSAQNFIDLLSTVDATRNAVKSKGLVYVVLPVFPDARGDRRISRSSLDLRQRVRELERAGANHIITLDVHNPSIELAFHENTGFDPLKSAYTFMKHLDAHEELRPGLATAVFVAPDAGKQAIEAMRQYSSKYGARRGIIDKSRDMSKPNAISAEKITFIGDPDDVKGHDAYLIDDMIDTAGTIVRGAEYLKQLGASNVRAISAHAIFSPPALERLSKAHADGVLTDVFTTNSVTHPAETIKRYPWWRVVPIDSYFAKVIDHNHKGESISQLLS